jgi:SAM-dependent methyltransferase
VAASSELIWHDLESGGYCVDFEFWLGLCPASVLELGAGTGRVSLALAMGGARVTAVDLDTALLRELRHRASALDVEGSRRSSPTRARSISGWGSHTWSVPWPSSSSLPAARIGWR